MRNDMPPGFRHAPLPEQAPPFIGYLDRAAYPAHKQDLLIWVDEEQHVVSNRLPTDAEKLLRATDIAGMALNSSQPGEPIVIAPIPQQMLNDMLEDDDPCGKP